MPTHTLTDHEASIIKAMIIRGDVLADIAKYYSVDSSRISEIKHGKAFADEFPLGANHPHIPMMGYRSTRASMEKAGYVIWKPTELKKQTARIAELSKRIKAQDKKIEERNAAMKRNAKLIGQAKTAQRELIDQINETQQELEATAFAAKMAKRISHKNAAEAKVELEHTQDLLAVAELPPKTSFLGIFIPMLAGCGIALAVAGAIFNFS